MKNALFSIRSIVAPISFGIGLFLLLTVLVNPINVYAASPSLPYYVDNDNFSFGGYSSSDIQSFINNKFINDGAPDYQVDFTNNTTLFYTYTSNNQDFLVIFTLYNSNQYYYFSNYSEIYDHFDISSDSMNLTFSQCYKFILTLNNGTLSWYTWYPFESQTTTLFGSYYTPVYINDIFYNQSYVNGVLNSSDTIVLTNYGQIINISGHATAPDPDTSFLGNNADFGASITSSSFPNVPTISHYNPYVYNPPSIDNSSVSSLLESIIDLIQYNLTYFVNSIQGFVTSIITTIESYAKYVGSIIAYVGKAIITNIQYAIQILYDNFVSLFEPVLNFISEVLSGIKTIVDEFISLGTDSSGKFSLTTLFVNLAIPDPEDLQDLIEDSDTFNVISVFSTINTKIRQEYATLQGLTSQKIIHVPSCIYHGQEIGDYDIDFSWYDRYKALGDGIISAFLIWNYLWFLFFRFPYWIRGNSADFNGISPKGSD